MIMIIKLQTAAAPATFHLNSNSSSSKKSHRRYKLNSHTNKTSFSYSTLSAASHKPLRYAVLGAGFAGLSVAWHLLQGSKASVNWTPYARKGIIEKAVNHLEYPHLVDKATSNLYIGVALPGRATLIGITLTVLLKDRFVTSLLLSGLHEPAQSDGPKELNVSIDIYDEVGIGGGASGVSGGLLHPYSPKVKLLWRGAECWRESLKLLSIAEAAVDSKLDSENPKIAKDVFIVRRRGILRPALHLKHLDILRDNAQNSLASCRIEYIDGSAAQILVPNLSTPLNSAFYMPQAINVNPRNYLEALFLACQNLSKDVSIGVGRKEIRLCQMSVNSLLDLEGKYSAVVVCLGARAVFLPELSSKLPLRTCRGVIAQLQLRSHISESYPDHGPSILSDAWLAVQGPQNLYMGSTWEWNSKNYSTHVPANEAAKVLKELLPKAISIYPPLESWSFIGARAGLRAMPPLSPNGSLPLLGCIDDFISVKKSSKFWFFGGLGSRGLLYHAWLGKLLAQAVISHDEGVLPHEVTSWRNEKEQ